MFKKILTLLIITSSFFSLLISLPALAKTKTSDYQVISAGYEHSLAVKSDGSLWAWGNNDYGQIGDGTTYNRYSPVPIGPDNDWVMVSGGFSHSLAVKSDGQLWAWGKNNYGQLGLGHNNNRLEPTLIRFHTAMPWLYLLLLSD